MKIALLMTGFPRTYSITYQNLKKNILDSHEVDIYICSWDKCQLRSGYPHIHADIESVLNTYSDRLVDYKFFDFDNYCENRFESIEFLNRKDDVFKIDPRAIEHGTYWVERLRDQWFIVKNAFSLIRNKSSYDMIMRLRFDVDLYEINIKNHEFVIPKDIGGWRYSDHFAYGNLSCMEKYCNTFEYIQDLYYTHNIDISHAVDMLKFYMEEYKISVKTFTDDSISYTILK
jgi:hypothetical protein